MGKKPHQNTTKYEMLIVGALFWGEMCGCEQQNCSLKKSNKSLFVLSVLTSPTRGEKFNRTRLESDRGSHACTPLHSAAAPPSPSPRAASSTVRVTTLSSDEIQYMRNKANDQDG